MICQRLSIMEIPDLLTFRGAEKCCIFPVLKAVGFLAWFGFVVWFFVWLFFLNWTLYLANGTTQS